MFRISVDEIIGPEGALRGKKISINGETYHILGWEESKFAKAIILPTVTSNFRQNPNQGSSEFGGLL